MRNSCAEAFFVQNTYVVHMYTTEHEISTHCDNSKDNGRSGTYFFDASAYKNIFKGYDA